jgi:hypothetical protein
MESHWWRITFLLLLAASASCSGGSENESENENMTEAELSETPETALAPESSMPEPANPQTGQNPANQRPTDITLIMDNSRQYTGTYHASQVSQVCGELSPEESITGERMFVVEFPYDGTPEITRVTFGSTKLVSGVTTTDQFRLNVGVRTKQGVEPQQFVMATVPPVARDMGQGTATLNVAAGTATLRVVGANEMGETIDITLVCRPRPD